MEKMGFHYCIVMMLFRRKIKNPGGDGPILFDFCVEGVRRKVCIVAAVAQDGK